MILSNLVTSNRGPPMPNSALDPALTVLVGGLPADERTEKIAYHL